MSSFAGSGKSSIANEIGHRLNDASLCQLVYWMKSDNLDEEFRQFALDLKAINQDEKLKKPTNFIIKQIAFKLRLKHMKEKFLFILDNCDSIENAKEYLDLIMQDKDLTNVKFLITTRTGSPLDKFDSDTQGMIRNCTQTFEIEPFEKSESIEFIQSNLKDVVTNETELNELIGLFDLDQENKLRPVILEKLTVLLKMKLDSANDFKTFIKELKSSKLHLDTLDDELFQNLIKKEGIVWDTLKHCSFMDPDFSPISIYTELLGFDENQLYDATEILKRLSID